MQALVVYESLWGNTAAVADAIVRGFGPGARALHTDEATPDVLAGVELVVAGAPVLGFRLPTEQMRESVRANPGKAPAPPDLSHPSLRSWLDALPPGKGCCAAFDTQVKGPFGKAAPAIVERLTEAGYAAIARPQGFIVVGRYGPLREGELERAEAWGRSLRAALAVVYDEAV